MMIKIDFTQVAQKMEKVVNAWITDIQAYPQDFKDSSINTLDQLIADEIANSLNYSDSEYECMSMDKRYDELFAPYKTKLETMLATL